MPKDYARHPSHSKNSWLEQGWGKRFLSVFLLLLLLSGIFAGFYTAKQKPWSTLPFNHWLSQLTLWLHQQNGGPVADTTSSRTFAQSPVAEAEPEIHFDFYTELPQMKVDVKQKKQNNTGRAANYFLDFGSYVNESIASERRLSLLLVGFEVDMVKLTENGKTIFHLQQGPFFSLASAQAIQQKLKNKGIDSKLRKMSSEETT